MVPSSTSTSCSTSAKRDCGNGRHVFDRSVVTPRMKFKTNIAGKGIYAVVSEKTLRVNVPSTPSPTMAIRVGVGVLTFDLRRSCFCFGVEYRTRSQFLRSPMQLEANGFSARPCCEANILYSSTSSEEISELSLFLRRSRRRNGTLTESLYRCTMIRMGVTFQQW